MAQRIQHYGWLVSPYSAKTRTYLRFKQIPFDDHVPSIVRLRGTIRKAVGQMIMPTVQLADGTWLQDSSDIIDTLEAMHPDPCTVPSGATQRLASSLLELHGDEWLPMVALHYRWNVPENNAFAMDEFARYGLPFLPLFLGKRVVGPVAKKMQGYLPRLGVTDDTISGVEALATGLIADLNTHLSGHNFILGGRPCIADFALFGPLWAHLFRDPGTTSMFDDAPHVRGWMDRILAPDGKHGAFLADDEVPETLDPIFQRVFRDQLAWVQTLTEAINAWCAENPDATRAPRSLGGAPFQIGGCDGSRKLATFVQWKAQRPWTVYQNATSEDQAVLSQWVARFSPNNPLKDPIQNPFVRRNFKAVLANASRVLA
jgi:glutathione S-transferase